MGERFSLVQSALNLNISAVKQNFKNLIKTKNLDKELLYPMH